MQFPTAEDVPPEALVDREILHVLPQAAVLLLRNQASKFRRKGIGQEVVRYRCRGGKLQARLSEKPGDLGVPKRLPIVVQIFVGEIAGTLRPHHLQAGIEHREHLEAGSIAVAQSLEKFDRVLDDGICRLAALLVEQLHEVLKRNHAEPARLRVVACVDEAAFVGRMDQAIGDGLAQRRRDPGQNAVKRDIVESAEIAGPSMREFGEVGLDEPRRW